MMVMPPAVVQLGLAGIAGALGAICVYPIDLVKTRLQSTAGGTSYGNAFEVVDTLTKEGGLPALYKGVGPQLTGVVPEKTIKLFVHDATLVACGEAVSGFLAGCCQVVVTNPLEVVKVRMQLSADGGMSVSDVASELGLRGLYTGSLACLARDATFSAILFPCYAATRTALAPLGSEDGALVLLLAGALAAVPAAFLTTPADVVKTRLQQGNDDADGLSGAAVARAAHEDEATVLGVLMQVVEAEGVAALFKGAAERVLRSSPQFGVTLFAFSTLKDACLERGWL